MTACKSYIKNEDIPENKEVNNYGFKHIKIDKAGNYKLIGCESDQLYGNDELFNFWSNKPIHQAIEKRNFKITGWIFMTLV